MFENIPAELKAGVRWLLWRYVDRGGPKPTKEPFQANGYHASVDDPQTWAEFEAVCKAYDEAQRSQNPFSGIGRTVVRGDGYVFSDLDATLDQAQLDIQNRIYEKFDTYTELSPSGKGVHLIGRAPMGVLGGGIKRGPIELYSEGRYFTFTGNVVRDVPIRDVQREVDILVEQLRGADKKHDTGYDEEPKKTDQEVLRACAYGHEANGELFQRLWYVTNTAEAVALGYPSQSEADQALINIIAFYSRNREQTFRIFQQSGPYERKKLDPRSKHDGYYKHTLSKAFDQVRADMNLDALMADVKAQVDAIRAERAAPVIAAPAVVENVPDDSPAAVTPPGRLGEVANFAYNNAYKPFSEACNGMAFGLAAGLCGRGWHVGGMGGNVYLYVLAPTGSGKNLVSHATAKIVQAVEADGQPSIAKRFGHKFAASGTGLHKAVQEQPCMLMMAGEFTLKLRDMNRDTNKAQMQIIRERLLEFFSASGPHGVVGKTSYADEDNNQQTILSPALSILAEGQPKPFYDLLDPSYLEDGFLGRWIIFEKPDFNKVHGQTHNIEVPLGLVHHIKGVEQKASWNEQKNTIEEIPFDDEAAAMRVRHRAEIEERLGGTDSDLVRELWARVQEKTMRLCHLMAAFNDPYNPRIVATYYAYARRLVEDNAHTLERLFMAGDVGQGETKRLESLVRVCKDYFTRQEFPFESYGATRALRDAGVIPYKVLQARLANLSGFRHVKSYNGSVIEGTLKIAVQAGLLIEVGTSPADTEFRTKFGFGVKANLYRPSKDLISRFAE